jgi:negative regulator of replication initiation
MPDDHFWVIYNINLERKIVWLDVISKNKSVAVEHITVSVKQMKVIENKL